MANITAKVMLSFKAEGEGSRMLGFSPDYADGANKEWAEATPALGLTMTVKPEVADLFEYGKAYTLTFTAAE